MNPSPLRGTATPPPGTARFDLGEAAAGLRDRRKRGATALGSLGVLCAFAAVAVALTRGGDGSAFLLLPLDLLGAVLLTTTLFLLTRPIPVALTVSSTGVTFLYPARRERRFDWTDPGFRAELGEMRPLTAAPEERRYSLVAPVGVPIAPPGYRAVFSTGWGRDLPLTNAAFHAVVVAASGAERIEEDVSQEGARYLTRYIRLAGPLPAPTVG